MLNTTTDPSIQLQVVAELQQVAQQTKDIEARIQHGATELEAADKNQAWSIQGGASGRYLYIVTMHHTLVSKDPNSPDVMNRSGWGIDRDLRVWAATRILVY